VCSSDLNSGAQALLLVANEPEAALLASELAAQPASYQRLPILSHWGLTGGDTIALSKGAILKLDIEFVQSFNFRRSRSPAAARLAERASQLLGIGNINAFPAQVGIAHAYDLMMMIGSAVSRLDRISGPAVLKAMTEIRQHQGEKWPRKSEQRYKWKLRAQCRTETGLAIRSF
jgi:branched-chain amino acid transport system substrate-binding protein